MLKDAALLQLDLLLAALDHDLILKDSTPYNVQFKGARPVFIDVGAFERLRERRAVGRLPPVLHALPLPAAPPGHEGRELPALAARVDRRHHPGGDARAHVLPGPLPPRSHDQRLPAARGSSQRDSSGAGIKREVKRAGLGKQLILANVRKMRKLVARLEWSPPQGVWLATASTTATRTTTPGRRTTSCARSRPRGRGRSCGTSAATTGATPASRRRALGTSWPSTPTRGPWSCSTGSSATPATRRSCR